MMATCSISSLETLLAEIGMYTPMPIFTRSDILNKPIDVYRNYLADIASRLLECEANLAYEAVQSANIKDNSDLALVLPKLKQKNKKPSELSREAFKKFSSTPLFQLPIPDGVHLRFIFSSLTLPRLILPYINDRMRDYGKSVSYEPLDAYSTRVTPKKVVIEFSSPNLATEFNSSHLRSTILGAQIANMYKNMGWDVVRMNYLGDWGKELGLLSVGWKRFGSEDDFHINPMDRLYDIYEKINELFKPEKEASKRARDEGRDTAEVEMQGIFAERDATFKKMEDGDAEAVNFFDRIRDISIKYYTEAYARLNITFDELSGESQVSQKSIAKVESGLKEKGVYELSGGSWIIDYTKHGPKSLGVSVLRGRTGSTSYLLRDIAAVFDRDEKYSFDKMIYVVTSEQDVHFQKVIQTLRYLGQNYLAEKLEHVGFGKAQGLSQQLGQVHLLSEILDKSVDTIRDVLRDQDGHVEIDNSEESANVLGITALVAQDGLNKRASGYIFNTKRLASFDGGSGPHLQYCYARLCAKINESDSDKAILGNVDYTYLQEDPWTEVLRLIAQYPDVTDSAYKTCEPSIILAYLFRLSEEVDNCLEDDEDEAQESISSKEKTEATLAQTVLYKHVRQVLDNGMSILGITPIITS
ncbi:arginyl-tRNA synthetase [Whalleya microplaca]|nr:arginyl-tRNA synthetase [Whalleya microplaca]